MSSFLSETLKAAVLAGTAALSLHSATAAESGGEAWQTLKFLAGTWEAKTQAGTAKAAVSGTYTFQFDLQGHVLTRHSGNEKCRSPADFDCGHTDLLFVYQDAGSHSYRAIYFDSEGHVIHYNVTMPAANTVTFLSDGSSPGPQFRLLYALNGGIMSGKFQVRMPGQADFNSYLEWAGTKK